MHSESCFWITMILTISPRPSRKEIILGLPVLSLSWESRWSFHYIGSVHSWEHLRCGRTFRYGRPCDDRDARTMPVMESLTMVILTTNTGRGTRHWIHGPAALNVESYPTNVIHVINSRWSEEEKCRVLSLRSFCFGWCHIIFTRHQQSLIRRVEM